jgi:lipopolysaccharide biosynthesis glycosyltransferase
MQKGELLNKTQLFPSSLGDIHAGTMNSNSTHLSKSVKDEFIGETSGNNLSSVIDIIYASDDNFAWIMGVSMLSLMENNSDVDICFHVLDGGIDEKNREKISLQCSNYGRKCIFYPVREFLYSAMEGKKTPRGSISMFSRLFVDQFLPKTIEKVLYIDCDTMIRGRLTEFWNTSFEDNIIIAVSDCFSDMHRKSINLKANNIYFNSGVLLINLNLWRAFDIGGKISESIEYFSKGGPYGDQCFLNLALSMRTKLIHPKYNCLPYLWGFSYSQLLKYRKPSFYYSEKEIKEALASPIIVHFASCFHYLRPWIIQDTPDNFCKEWRQYLTLSLWAEYPLKKDKRKFQIKFFLQMYHFMPTFLTIPILGILHSKIMPFIEGKKYSMAYFIKK